MNPITMSSDTAAVPDNASRAGISFETFLARYEGQTPERARQPTAPRPQASAPLMTAKKLFKSYRKSKHIIPVLRGVDFSVDPGEFVAIVGQSGSGKTTLLHLLGTLDEPDAGEIHFEDNRIDNLPTQARDVLRNRYFGMIFQFYHLLPELTTLENVLAPRMISDGVLRYWLRRRQHVERPASSWRWSDWRTA
jgi:lipoprotein-releasing system ATP-binding protein